MLSDVFFYASVMMYGSISVDLEKVEDKYTITTEVVGDGSMPVITVKEVSEELLQKAESTLASLPLIDSSIDDESEYEDSLLDKEPFVDGIEWGAVFTDDEGKTKKIIGYAPYGEKFTAVVNLLTEISAEFQAIPQFFIDLSGVDE